MKPGLTCLWQVSGRNNVSDFKDWVRLDLEYIDNWSLWLDAENISGATVPGRHDWERRRHDNVLEFPLDNVDSVHAVNATSRSPALKLNCILTNHG